MFRAVLTRRVSLFSRFQSQSKPTLRLTTPISNTTTPNTLTRYQISAAATMEESEYERQRAENIAKNKALLKQLQLDSLSASLTASSSAKSSPRPKSTPRKSAPRVKKERTESPVTRRQSSRLAGIPVDSEAEKRKLEDESQALQAAESAKRQRVAGDLSFEIKRGLLGKDAWEDKTLTKEEVDGMEEGDLKQTRKRLMGLKIWEEFAPSGTPPSPSSPWDIRS
jgi:hypothetical protein